MKTIIVWDFSWIQNYLYDIQKNKSATKRLKWRSAFIELLLEKVRDDLVLALWDCEKYITSWGKFIIFCNEFDQGKFDEYKKDLESKLFKQFYGQLKIIFWISPFPQEKEHKEALNGKEFQSALNQAFEDLEKNKKRAFESVFLKDEKWDSDAFVIEGDRGTDSVCTFSRGDLIEVHVWEHKILDTFLQEEALNGISRNTANDLLLSNYVCWKEVWKSLKIFGTESLNLNTKIRHPIPTKKENWETVIKSFEDLAGDGNFNKLACLKGDIDDLWKLVLFGLKEDNYEENYKKFSKLLDNFWDKTLYDLVQGKDLYVVYAWGDDFLILGKWDEIIKLYLALLQSFDQHINQSQEIAWVLLKKPSLHFSWAINLFWPHDTFFTVVKQTSALLEEAKAFDKINKDKINIFGKVIANGEIQKLFDEIKAFEEKYKIYDESVKIISTSTLRFLLDIARKILLSEEAKNWLDKEWNKVEFFEYGLWHAELFYMLGRNYTTKNWNTEKDEFRKYIDSMLIWKTLPFFKERAWEKLYVMMSYVLYKKREK